MTGPYDAPLDRTYEEWRRKGSADWEWAKHFWAPLLVAKPDDWKGAQHRVAIVGQETGNWGAGPDLDTLSQFFARTDAVSVLQDRQRGFVADHRASPFFQYFKKVQEALASNGESVSAVWTNVIRCSSNGRGGFRLAKVPEPDNELYREWQKGLLREELRLLKPTLITFLSGPNYDGYLSSEFSGLEFKPLPGFSGRQAVQLRSSDLIAPAYRTYHPNYLTRALRFAPLRAVIQNYRETLG